MAGFSKAQLLEREAIKAIYNHACAGCGSPLDLEIDHVIPTSKGGPDTRDNKPVLCHHCNNAKNGKFEAENHDRYKYGPRMPSHIQLLSAIETLENRGTEKALAELKLIKEHHNV